MSAWAFYDGSMTERMESKRTGRPIRRQYPFRLPGAGALLLATAHESDWLVTYIFLRTLTAE